MKHGTLPPGWKTTELLPDDPKVLQHVKEVAKIAKEIAAIPRVKQAPPTHFNGKLIADLSYSEKEEFHLSLQPESTKAAILAQKKRSVDDDGDHFLRALPSEEDWKRDRESRREITPEEFMLHKGLQRAEKNTLGQTTKASLDTEKRERGIHAFTYSQPATPGNEDLKRLKELTPLKAVMATEVPERPKPAKKPWWKKIFSRDDARPLTDAEWNDFFGKPRQ